MPAKVLSTTSGRTPNLPNQAPPVVIDQALSTILLEHHLTALSTEAVVRNAQLYSDLVSALEGRSKSSWSTLASSIVQFAIASCGSSQYCDADMQALIGPINSSSLRPMAVLLAPPVIKRMLQAEARLLSGRGTSAGADEDMRVWADGGSLLHRIHQSMCSAVTRNQGILATHSLPLPLGEGLTTAPAIGSAAGIAASTSPVNPHSPTPLASTTAGGVAAAGRPPLRASLTPSALRDRAAIASVFALPVFSEVNHENVSVIVYSVLCACAYVTVNVLQLKDMAVVGTCRRFADSLVDLFVDIAFWNVARHDSAITTAIASILQSISPLYTTSATAGTTTTGASEHCVGKSPSDFYHAVQMWTDECMVRSEHSMTALALMTMST